MSTKERAALRKMCNRLALVSPTRARMVHICTFCGQPIQRDDLYRSAGLNAKAHDICFRAVAKNC